uniref:Arf-GAP with coiled-coil, ANK repeat and PH domain-containing protein n=1 Tax=Panagrolaimus sp. ES5 TaxID=591445 RepID=A0AC34F324_9BILA
MNNLWHDLNPSDSTANEAYSSLSDAFAQIVHLNKTLVEYSYPALRVSLESFVKKELHGINESRQRFEQMSSDFDEAITKKASLNKTKVKELHDAKNSLMAIGTLFAHTSLDYVSHIQIAHSRKCHVILESLSTFITDYSTFFRKGHYFFQNTSEIDMDKINNSIKVLKDKSKIVDRKMQERHSAVPKEVYQHPTGIPTDPDVVMEGYLMKRATNAFKTWNRRWFQIKEDKLLGFQLYSHRHGDARITVMEENLQLCLVRVAPSTIDRACCFELVTPSKNHLLQADSETLCNAWILALQRTIQHLHENGQGYRPQKHSLINSINEACANSPSVSSTNGFGLSSATMPVMRNQPLSIVKNSNRKSEMTPSSPRTTRRQAAQIQMKKRIDKNFAKVLSLPGNNKCADCGNPETGWASINLGILICIECSGAHRSLGVHNSKIRSLKMDDIEETQWQILLKLGNDKVNALYLSNLPEKNPIPSPATVTSTRPQREAWITAKYVDKRFCDKKISSTAGAAKGHIRSSSSAVIRQQSLSDYSVESSTTAAAAVTNNIATPSVTPNSARSDSGLSVDAGSKRFSRSSYGSDNNLEHLEHNSNTTEVEKLALEALKDGNLEEMRKALNFGLDLNVPIGTSFLLHSAIKNHDTTMAEFLLLNGSKLCVIDSDGNTPLHIAATNGFPILVYQLLKKNADSTIKNKEGQTALDIAVDGQHAHIVTLLRLHEMKTNDEDYDYEMDQTLDNFILELANTRESELSLNQK